MIEDVICFLYDVNVIIEGNYNLISIVIILKFIKCLCNKRKLIFLLFLLYKRVEFFFFFYNIESFVVFNEIIELVIDVFKWV